MPTTRQITIAEGDAGTDQTVQVMGELIRAGALTPAVRHVALSVAANAPNELVQLVALRDWVSRHFKFVRDPASGELLHDTEYMLAEIGQRGYVQGDCDDAAILAGALACSIGASVALVLVAVAAPGDPERDEKPFSHVWASASPPVPCIDPDSGRQVWIEYDVTRPAQFDALSLIRRAKPVLIC